MKDTKIVKNVWEKEIESLIKDFLFLGGAAEPS